MEELRRRYGIGRWSGSGGLYGTRAQVREARRLIRSAMAGKIDRLQFVDDRLLRLLPRLARPYRALTGHDLNRTVNLLVPVYNLLKGIPTTSALGSSYWRKAGSIPQDPDPDRDRCGLLWLSPASPNTGRDAAEVTGLASSVMLAHGFEPIISVSLMNERTIVSVIALTYDRDVPGEDERALACHDELADQFMSLGYPPYRLGLASMRLGLQPSPDDAYATTIGRMKDALDPLGILAPGRYSTKSSETKDVRAPREGRSLAK
jgi:4-cresol dehydrogenase (hydroxylating)